MIPSLSSSKQSQWTSLAHNHTHEEMGHGRTKQNPLGRGKESARMARGQESLVIKIPVHMYEHVRMKPFIICNYYISRKDKLIIK